jgi:KaiC/GvpD/RAD55 family RecA-like ATPase
MQASDSAMENPHEAMADRLRLCVPRELWQYRQWVVWRYEPGRDKPRKVPYYVTGARRSGDQGAPGDLANLATFEQAEEVYRAGGFDGVGLAILEESPIKAIDLDACVDANGALLPQAEAILNQADSYSEFSPSGGGVRILAYGAIPSVKAMNKFGPGRHLELFGTSGFVTITGNLLGESTVRPMVPEFRNWLCEQAGATDKKAGNYPREIPLQFIDATQAEHLRSALQALDPDDYHQWINDGIALRCLGDAGLEIWLEQGRRSPRFDLQQALRKWAGFKPTKASYQSIFARAQDKGWVNPMSKGAAPAVAPIDPAESMLLTTRELAEIADALRWAVDDTIPENSIGMLFGATGTYKSFIALDYALHRAWGMNWLGRKTRQATPIYIAAEGGAGLMKRLRAWHLKHGKDVMECPMRLLIRPISLTTQAVDLRDAVKALGITPGDIVIDTMSQTFNGEENSAKEVSEFFRQLGGVLREEFQCTVLMVHHTGHSANDRARGSSVMEANLDFQIMAESEKGSMIAQLTCVKQKEDERFEPLNFVIEKLTVGKRDDGKLITSLAAAHVNQTNQLLEAVDKKSESHLSIVIQLVREFEDKEIIRREFYSVMGESTGEAKRKAFNRSLAKAVAMRIVAEDANGRLSIAEGQS